MYCSKCGQQNIDTANFCLSCGNVLNAPVEKTFRQAPPSVSSSGQPQPPPPTAVPSYTPAYMPKQKKPYRAEYSLGLVGAIIASVLFFIIAITCVVELIGNMTSSSYYSYQIEGLYFLTTFFWLISFVLGYVGIGQINKLNLSGGGILIIGACLGLICMFLVPFGLLAVLYWPLLLSGGITALARKNHLEKYEDIKR